jgi:hypothetical protein
MRFKENNTESIQNELIQFDGLLASRPPTQSARGRAGFACPPENPKIKTRFLFLGLYKHT